MLNVFWNNRHQICYLFVVLFSFVKLGESSKVFKEWQPGSKFKSQKNLLKCSRWGKTWVFNYFFQPLFFLQLDSFISVGAARQLSHEGKNGNGRFILNSISKSDSPMEVPISVCFGRWQLKFPGSARGCLWNHSVINFLDFYFYFVFKNNYLSFKIIDILRLHEISKNSNGLKGK